MSLAAPDPRAPDPELLESTRALVRAGRLLALAILTVTIGRDALSAAEGTRWIAALVFGAPAVALWGLAAWAQQRLLLGGLVPAAIARGNPAAAIALAANEVALALMTARAVTGDSTRQLPAALVFGALAVGTWAVFVALFRAVTTYADGAEIVGHNQAAAISYAGAALALAWIIGHAVDGPFAGWATSLRAYLAALGGSLALYPVRQLVIGALLLGQPPRLRGGELDRAIGQRRSAGVAAAEAAVYLGTAWLVVGV